MWDPSTDNFIVSGYVLFRDGVPIATTTLTSYSDAGLTASTTYAYFLQAFDLAGNYSTSSATSTVTTPAVSAPTATTSDSGSNATIISVVTNEVIVDPGVSTTSISIATEFPARFEIRWGRTASYELGFIGSDILRRDYQTILTDLEPGTTYEYEIIGYTPSGQPTVIERGQFRTLGQLDVTAPANARRFTADPAGDDVLLAWQLPDDESVAFVRVVRSHLGYPTSPTDGAVIYQGVGNTAVDLGVLARYSPAYYTVFVYDTAGNVSSGAVAVVYAADSLIRDPDEPSVDSDTDVPGDTDVLPPLPPLASTTQKMPDPFEIMVIQTDQQVSFGREEIVIDGDEAFLISIDSAAITSNLKSIIVELQDPTDQRQRFAFLLRLNKDQTAYEAMIAPLRVSGKSAMVLSVYDFRALRVAEYRTKVTFVSDGRTSAGPVEKGSTNFSLFGYWLIAVLLVGLILWWLIVFDRDDEDEDTEAAVEE